MYHYRKVRVQLFYFELIFVALPLISSAFPERRRDSQHKSLKAQVMNSIRKPVIPRTSMGTGAPSTPTSKDQVNSATILMQGASLDRDKPNKSSTGNGDDLAEIRQTIFPPPIRGVENWGIPAATKEPCNPGLQVSPV